MTYLGRKATPEAVQRQPVAPAAPEVFSKSRCDGCLFMYCNCIWLYIYYITYYYTTTMYNNLQHTGIFLVSGFFEIFQVFLENLLTYVFSNLAIFRFGFPHIPRLLKRRETPETESTPTTEAGDENRWITPWVGLWKMGEIFKILYILYICIVYIYIYIYLYLIFLFYTNIRFCWNDTTSWCFYIF